MKGLRRIQKLCGKSIPAVNLRIVDYMNGKILDHFPVVALKIPVISGLYLAGVKAANGIVPKGAWVLHMLRRVMGDSNFFATVKNYVADPNLAYGNAVTEDFQKHCEAVYGKELNWFFQQWIYRPGRPDYEYRWQTAENGRSYVTTLNIDQSIKFADEERTLYKMLLEIHLSGVDLDTVVTVWDSLASQKFEIVTSQRPRTLSLDPDDWVLKRLRELKNSGFPDVPETMKLDQNSPNPFRNLNCDPIWNSGAR